MTRAFKFGMLLLFLALAGCGSVDRAAGGDRAVILVIGDSLSAGYGLASPETQGWVARLEQQWREDAFLGPGQRVVNASVSGETTSGGLDRLPDLLTEHQPTHVVIELGANDLLRRQSMAAAENNLDRMISLVEEQGGQTAILAVDMPGIAKIAGGNTLDDIYERLANKHETMVVDYPLGDLYGEPGMLLDDRMHPSLRAQAVLARELDEDLRKFLAR